MFEFQNNIENPKLQLCRQHVPLEVLYLVFGRLIVRPKENTVGTPAIWDFLSCHHHYKGVKPFQKRVSEGPFSTIHFRQIIVTV